MAFDRNIWNQNIKPNDPINPVPWPCPFCNHHSLSVMNGGLYESESLESKMDRDSPAWDIEWVHGCFAGLLICSWCSESLTICGRYRVNDCSYIDDKSGIYAESYSKSYETLYIFPSPRIIDIPAKIPEEIRNELAKSFQLFWADIESCANRIRSCLEKLLDAQKVKKTAKSKSGKRVRVNLHGRVEAYEKTSPKLASIMMAVKWLGNAGSHSSAITREDALDGYEMLEYVISEIYTNRTDKVEKLARQINKHRRPRSTQKGKPIH